ncbi:hypothetical protein DFH06DRAFT_1291127 [Mycena polygramma]|nr:hypothetical protein DFH06DRAFT_1291127 [Mycena polygramma]
MTEYDYSPEAVDQYVRSQARIQQWTAQTARSRTCDPSTPPTPVAPRSIGLPPSHATYGPPPLPEPQSEWTQKSQTALRKIKATGGTPPPRLAVKTPALGVPANQVYSYKQKTTPHGSKLSITTQTTDGQYVQQQSYRETTRALHPESQQTLAVPPVNYAPLAHNPFPVQEQFQTLPRATAPPSTRVRSKSSHSERRALPGGLAPPVPSMPERHRAHSNVRPPGAAAPLHPATLANDMYAPPSAVSSLQLPTPYYPPPQQQMHMQQQQPQYSAMAKSKSKSSATLNTRYATEARRPQLQDAPPMPMSQQAQTGFYATPRASKSSATLYAAEPRSSPRKSSKSKSKSSSKHSHRPPMPEFGERMSSPHPAASQMLVHSLVPLATYREETPEPRRVKSPSLFQRIFLGKSKN